MKARQAAELRFTGTVSAPVAIAGAIINPFFEEFLFLGYGITAVERFGLRTAIVVSVALRTAIHAYQGAMALVGILPMAIVFTLYYVRTRRLWPVIVAHIIMDALGLGALVGRSAG
ncbi:MAG: CPBP family intramembrane glutamic endopeptidase [Gemmatimonadaceae bacterium]